MATVIAEKSMSLDGFIADPSDAVAHIFDWYGSGRIEVPTATEGLTFNLTDASARFVRDLMSKIRALVVGRRLFDITNGWGGRHPYDVPVFVVTHRVPEDWEYKDTAPFTFVTGGVESAVSRAKALAGDGIVGVGGANVIQQCLVAGLIDEVVVSLAPVLLGEGVRLFDNLTNAPILLENPEVIEGDRVTHLRYRVQQ